MNINNRICIIDKRLKRINIKRVEKYINSRFKILVKCLICGYKWKRNFKGKKTRGCPICSINKQKIKINKIKRILRKRNIKLLDVKYKNCKNKMRYCCLIDKTIWKSSLDSIINGNTGCPVCGGSKKLNNKDIDKRIKNRKIKRLENIINAITPIRWKCLVPNCNCIWKARPTDITNLRQLGCPNCSLGKSEKHIKALIKKHINYDYLEPHKTFRFNSRKYYPDFYLEINSKKIIIEYNGRQHYEPVEFGGISKKRSYENYVIQKNRDIQVRKYCKENNICLLEIPYYWKEDKIIEKIKYISEKYNIMGRNYICVA